MSARVGTLSVDPGLLARYRAAGEKIAWRSTSGRRRGRAERRVRIAHLHDEEARVEVWGRSPSGHVAVDSGPLGALVLLLEVDRRGPPTAIGAQESGRDPAFPGGAIEAAWGGGAVPRDAAPTLADLVELARYALA